MTNPLLEYKQRELPTEKEIDETLQKAEKLPTEYFQLRAKCLIAIAKVFGKRRNEIGRLERTDITENNEEFTFKFNLSKKRKIGLHQFLMLCEKDKILSADVLQKPLPEIQRLWKDWQLTEAGHRKKNTVVLHAISAKGKYAAFIKAYLNYLDEHYPESKYIFPSGTMLFGTDYIINEKEHLSGSQLLRILKPLNSKLWLHLFRELKGAQIAQVGGRSLDTVYQVKDTLDLENEATAMIYIRRYAAKRHLEEQ